ncbi:DNA integrity scanning protein DisA [uncultured Clostridium sp.]|uniref:Diadenylate cyclase n=1 Tax=Muricoprocola aceti TaxID=2981772 RepID=A0ABT2SK06_9FIRM|nr:diadenylate cyclase CdaA [Muricoprocola aceti]MCI7226743.1 diadenylate cyclase CdaA [Lachnospiraceae bacterium]MCQ4772597.1 diadenylate cyclase CdaA [Lacrimispora saccharolytica]SCH27175.1 DNA integrity scanning protein DisA [uncultured Clostridium sp.]MCU6724786.1 diadenylate cyclase CdaA [Muricoprocola aceti]MDD7436110.1 diadenylate cyclase CdaA [Lachnospiraceae bacterium]
MQTIKMWFIQYIPGLYIFRMPVGIIDIIEIILLSFLVYTILVWIKNTRAWTLLKGIIFLGFFVALIYLFHMDTLIFIINKGLNIAIIAAIIIFQPELRKALEILGEKMFLVNIFGSGNEKDVEQRCSDKTVNELVRATVEMAKVKTGALIVLEQNETLEEYERTGIDLDALVSSQLLINIFEHNTPLHDGAVIIKGDKIRSATCYLPLSENLSLSKALGTRHRAGVGISEVTDSVTIIVSEETGKISIAQRGRLRHNVQEEELRTCLVALQNKVPVTKKGIPGVGILRKKGKESDEA